MVSKGLPNLFIVGAPKCGTTSLARSLADHPDIYLPFIKEPHYFGSDTPTCVDDYSALYANGQNYRIRIDASTHYLASRDAISQIMESCPDAKIIAVFRHPVEAVPAFHSQLLRHNSETARDFTVAWAAQNDRSQGRVQGPVYFKYYAYGTQVERLFKCVPSESIRLFSFDQLKYSSKGMLLEIQDFLGVKACDLSMRHENINHGIRSASVNSLKLLASRWARAVKLMSGIDRNFGLMGRLFNFATEAVPRHPLDETVRKEIGNAFAEELQTFHRLTRIALR